MNPYVVMLGSWLVLLQSGAGPAFKDYPVGEVFRGTPAEPVLSTRRARDFRTQLRNETKSGANFAGHYTLARWGCGAGCVTVAVVDALSGRVWFAPFTVEDGWKDGHVICDHSTDFRVDSELFVASGKVNGRFGTHYFRWHGTTFSRLGDSPSCDRVAPGG